MNTNTNTNLSQPHHSSLNSITLSEHSPHHTSIIIKSKYLKHDEDSTN